MGKKIIKTAFPIIAGIILCLFVIITDNFSFIFAPSMQSKFMAVIGILLPKLAFGAVLGMGFTAVLPLSDTKDGIFALLTPIAVMLIYQAAEIFIKWDSICALLSSDLITSGTNYPVSLWIFIVILAFLDILYFDTERWTRLTADLLIVFIITIIFCIGDFTLPVFINYKYLVGFQIGGYFIVRGILHGQKN